MESTLDNIKSVYAYPYIKVKNVKTRKIRDILNLSKNWINSKEYQIKNLYGIEERYILGKQQKAEEYIKERLKELHKLKGHIIVPKVLQDINPFCSGMGYENTEPERELGIILTLPLDRGEYELVGPKIGKLSYEPLMELGVGEKIHEPVLGPKIGGVDYRPIEKT